jgi:DNA-binding NarL/FixJ family response regulator
MRVALVGPRTDRDRVRDQLIETGVEIVEEFASLSVARRNELRVDAIVLAQTDGWQRDRDSGLGDAGVAVIETLTAREHDVLDLLAQGLTNKAIATRLAISDQTVKAHVAAIAGKLGASNRTDAVRRAVRHGLITL